MDNIDLLVENNAGGNLSEVIASTNYQPASEGIVLPAEPGRHIVDGRLTDAAPQVAGQQPLGVTTQPQLPQQPVVDPTQSPQYQQAQQQLEAQMRAAALARIEAEEARFEADIAHLSEEEQDRKRLERQVEQTQQVNAWLNQQRQTERMTLEQRQQDIAKRQWGFLYARQAGLPFENPAIRSAILAANDRTEMQQIVQGLVNYVNSLQGQQAQQQLTNGVFAAGASNETAPPAGPKQRSGDIEGLIAARGYTLVNMG